MRTYDIEKVVKATSQYSEEIEGFYPKDWLSDTNNVVLINDNEDIALFERVWLSPRTVYGHYFFWSRGKDAVFAAKEFLNEIFTGGYSVEIILGLTPLNNKGALWMNSRLGFKKLEQTDSIIGPLQVVMLTKKDWEQNK
jgi:hypothetical protein